MKLRDLTAKILSRRDDSADPLRIVQAGHPALRASSVAFADQLDADELSALLRAMVITMHEAPGVGVAAPQIGLPLRLVVMEDSVGFDEEEGEDPLERRDLPLHCIANPRYEGVGETVVYAWEGCLSVDGWRSIVPRHQRVRVRGTVIGADGSRRDLDEVWSGWPARIFQHEADHLDGILCHDRAVDRSMIWEDYAPYYEELTDAVDYLGLTGPITELNPGEVAHTRSASQS
ncbi:peptide deformylase [Helcobacillus massiliensis]|uniref:Peptide deformylase n=1 Tax=Helcobacillus massiliensis TaxID=521392 RepID=A0A839QUZ3_9MICO|nr:peptide deformylase [Helcobacillus massiliensis]MBB3022669.1 peptide deformylase [Helcobacillus massiliensis]